jgi:hypothetical protein
MNTLAKTEIFKSVVSTVKDTCHPDESGEYKVTELLSQALSLRNYMDTNSNGDERILTLEVIDDYILFLMDAFQKAKKNNSKNKKIMTAPSVPKSIQLKKQRQGKKEDKKE